MSEQAFKGAPPFVQVIIALNVWETLTPKQREIVAAARYKRSRSKAFYKKWGVRAAIDAPPQTMASLERKGVVANGNLTDAGLYAALWQGGKEGR